jgi:hypothetical protein
VGPEKSSEKITEPPECRGKQSTAEEREEGSAQQQQCNDNKGHALRLTHVHMLSPLDAMSTHFRGSFCNRWVGGVQGTLESNPKAILCNSWHLSA